MSHEKKVLFVITKATWGGAQKYVYDLATRLPRKEYAVAVAYGEEGKLAEMLREKSIQLHQISPLSRDIAVISDIVSFWQILRL